jgi:hypothetical protein
MYPHKQHRTPHGGTSTRPGRFQNRNRTTRLAWRGACRPPADGGLKTRRYWKIRSSLVIGSK